MPHILHPEIGLIVRKLAILSLMTEKHVLYLRSKFFLYLLLGSVG